MYVSVTAESIRSLIIALTIVKKEGGGTRHQFYAEATEALPEDRFRL